MRKLIFLIVLYLFSNQHIISQTYEQFLAKVIDIETSDPISYATIRIKDTDQGIIADYNGEFRIPLKYKDGIILITSIGYEAKAIPLSALKENGINIIKLNIQVEALNPVFISSSTKVKGANFNPKNVVKQSRKLSAKEIVLRAIKEIPNNLSDIPHSYIGYYRDYQLLDNKFHNLNEAVIETFDQGISSNFLEKNTVSTAVYSFEQNTDFTIAPSLTQAYDGTTKYIKHSQILPRGGNEHTLLSIHNPIRNYNFSTFSYVYRLDTDFPKLHKFRKDKVIFLNNEPLVIINIKKANDDNKGLYGLKTGRIYSNEIVEGSLYISLVDFSIHRFNYKVQPPKSNKALYSVSLEYTRQNEKMYLNYITFNNAFVIAEKFILEEELIEFDKSEQAFYVTFNNTKDYLDYRTIIPKNFRFKLGGKKLETVSAERETSRIMKIKVRNFNGVPIDINSNNNKELSYKFKNIRDVANREIYRARTLNGDQFREFFVQKVNENKSPSNNLSLTDKNVPLHKSTINQLLEKDEYWMNTPLMDKKYRDQ